MVAEPVVPVEPLVPPGVVVPVVPAVVVAVVVAPVVVVVVVGGITAHAGGAVMVSALSVTSPLRARTRPSTVAPAPSVSEVSAMIVPTKVLDELRVAELLTCQKTLQARAPLTRSTTLSDAVTRSDDAWKTKTELASPCPSRTSGLAAVMLAVDACPNA